MVVAFIFNGSTHTVDSKLFAELKAELKSAKQAARFEQKRADFNLNLQLASLKSSNSDPPSVRRLPDTDEAGSSTEAIPKWQYLRNKAVEQRKLAAEARANKPGQTGVAIAALPPPPPPPIEQHPSFWADEAHNLYSTGTVEQRAEAYSAVMGVEMANRKAKYDEIVAVMDAYSAVMAVTMNDREAKYDEIAAAVSVEAFQTVSAELVV